MRKPPKTVLAQLMDERGITTSHIIGKCGISQPTVSNWRCGDKRPHEKHRKGLEALFGCTLEELLRAPNAKAATIAPPPAPIVELKKLPWIHYPADPVTCEAIAGMFEGAIASAKTTLTPAAVQFFEENRDYLRALAHNLRVDREATAPTSTRTRHHLAFAGKVLS